MGIESNVPKLQSLCESLEELSEKDKTITTLKSRLGRAFIGWLKGIGESPKSKYILDYVEEYLRDELSVEIRDDGLIEFYLLDGQTSDLIGDLPVVLFHHTASGVLDRIKKEGLRPGIDVNRWGKPAAGVYLTSLWNDVASEGYFRRAAAIHGGEPVTITVRVRVSNLVSDPDDEDLSSGRYQWVVPYIPREDIIDVAERW